MTHGICEAIKKRIPKGINPEDLTPEQLVAIQDAIATYNTAIAKRDGIEGGIAERYYDCQDDYSYGNPYMEKANAQIRARIEQNLQDKIEEIVRGGFLIRTRKVNILRDIKTGEVAACGTHDGQYGRYFRTYERFGNKCISTAKKVATYEKKGFRPYIQEVTEKVKRAGYWRNGEPRYEFIDYVAITETISTEIVYS